MLSYQSKYLSLICALGAGIPISAFVAKRRTQKALKREPYFLEMEKLILDYPPLHKRLGTPVTTGWVCRGMQSKTEFKDNSVILEIPVEGKNDTATVIGEAVKSPDNRWVVTDMKVTLHRTKKSWQFYSNHQLELPTTQLNGSTMDCTV